MVPDGGRSPSATYADGVPIPIACHLTDEAAVSQLQEWRTVLAEPVTSRRLSPTELALRLPDDLAPLEAIVRLARREKACCPFFDFALRIEAEAVTLTVTVPEEAASLLDSLAP
jgi:hypothetical protein